MIQERMSSIKMPGPHFQTPIVFVNSNAHGQIKQASETTIETVNRQSISDMTIIEINIASPTVVNILDDDTVHYLSKLISKKLKYMESLSQTVDFDQNLMIMLRQIDKEYTSLIENKIVKQVIGQFRFLIEELTDIITPNRSSLSNKEALMEFTDEDGSSIIEQIRDRIHFMDSFNRDSMFDYNFYTRENMQVPMIKTHFTGDNLTSEDMNWRITAEELFEVPTRMESHFISGRRIPELIRSEAEGIDVNYIVENKIDLLRFLPTTTITRNDSSPRLKITNEQILQYLYETGYRKVIIFNNSCATAIDKDGIEITNPRTMRALIKDAKDIRQLSRIELPTLNLRKMPTKLENYEKLKEKIIQILQQNGYTLADAEINPNIRRKGGFKKSKIGKISKISKKSKGKKKQGTKKRRNTYKIKRR